MATPSLSIHRIKLELDVTRQAQVRDYFTHTTPIFYKGFDLQIDCGVTQGSTMLMLDDVTTATIKLKPINNRNADAYMTQTTSTITASVTRAFWDADSEKHFGFTFDSTDTNFSMPTGSNSGDYWAVIYATKNDGSRILISTFTMRRDEAGDGGSAPPQPAPPESYTKAELDALVAGKLGQSNPAGYYCILSELYLRDASTGHMIKLTAVNDALETNIVV